MDQLLLVYDEVTANADSGHTIDLVLLNFSKAFDVASHQIVLHKLQLIGIEN